MGTSLYQLYDGTLKLWGCKKMLWHRMAIEEKKIQILPPERRHFPFAPTADNFNMKDAINMSSYCNGAPTATATAKAITENERQACSDELLQQLRQDGFAFVRGTGMSEALCQEAVQMTRAFLSDADEDTRRSCLTKDRARRGYSPMCTENFASLIGKQGPNDLVRKWRMGPKEEESEAQNSLLQPNVWPSAEAWEASCAKRFRETLEAYYDEACRAANCIVSAICDAVQRERPELQEAFEVFTLSTQNDSKSTSILTLLGYQVGTRHKGKKKSPLVAPHTDVGVVTMLLFDGPGCAQLQRSGHAGGWVDVNLPSVVPRDPIFVVNIGDCLSEITGKLLPSTLHRVVADTKVRGPRHCLALFVGLEAEARLLVDGETMSFEEWRKWRIARAQDVLKSSTTT
jgi:isopenicillin N synthase-like dioxygenase